MRGVLKALAAPFTQTAGLARWMLVAGLILTAVFVICALFAPWLAPFGFAQSTVDGVRFPKAGPPSADHWFGTDRLFFDVFSRVIWGARTALEVVILSIMFCVVIGVPLGLISGYYGGWLDRILVLIMDAVFAFPSFLLAIVFSFLLTGLLGGSVIAVSLSLTAIYIPQYFRVVRNTTVSAKEATYVEAARAIGASDGVIMRRYLFGIRDLVDRPLPGSGHRFPGDRADPRGRGAERDAEPNPATPQVAACRHAGPRGHHVDQRGAAMSIELIDEPIGVHPQEPVISARDVRVWYGTTRGAIRAVDGVTFDLAPGETLGLVGESGCGKSTLGRGLMGLLPEGAKRDGEVLFRGRDIFSLSRKEAYRLRGSELGMIFQEPLTRLNPLMRISQHFEETIKQHDQRLSKAEIKERALEALRLMGIPPTRYKSYPHEFSGGMRQRLMIALALVLRPAFVVADEPTTALDVLVEAQIVQILNDLRRNFQTSMLLITHNVGIVAEACDRVAVMYAGRIVEQGSVADVFKNPQHPYTRELLRSTISLRTTGLNFIPGAPPDLVDPPDGCRFHPRCPQAMNVCASRNPVNIERRGGGRVECWLSGPEDQIPAGGTLPLKQEELAVADEA